MTLGDDQKIRHILSLSGGKDSTALAIYMRDRIPDMEYVFCDTGEELPETYEYLNKVELFLGREINRLSLGKNAFDNLLKIRNGFLPSAQVRWCTENLKIKPFEKFVGNDLCYSYIGIRADEAQRKGYISTKPNIISRYPFIDNNIIEKDVYALLLNSGLGLPEYYKWRSRSGCYFCFFQQRIEWVGLLENHPDLFEKAKEYERIDSVTNKSYTWSAKESLSELQSVERINEIKIEFQNRQKDNIHRNKGNLNLLDVFSTLDKNSNEGCLICHL